MDLQTSIKSYKNNVASKYDFLDASNLKQIGDQKYFCSKKIDGQTFFLSVQEDTIQILNSSFQDYSSNLQHIIDEVKNLKIKEKIIFVGELFDSSKERERNGDVIVGLSSKDQSSNLALALFDIAKQENTSHSFSGKYEKIKKLFGDDYTKPIFALSQQELELSEIQKFFDDCLQNDSEGIILRNDANITKVKKQESIDAVILGYTLEVDQKTLRSVSFGSFKNNNEIIFIGSSGNFDSSINQSDLLSQLQKLNIECDYIQIASNGTAYQFVKPEIVISVDFYDTQIEKSDQQPIKKPIFSISNDSLRCIGKNQSMSFLASTISAVRSDKEANKDQCGLSQLTRITGLDEDYFGLSLDLENLAKSEITKIQTFVKESKKGKAIRKFMLWKTNKEQTGVFPPYVFYYLDYSEGRKDPIKRDLNPFDDEKKALNFFNLAIEENVKKGWEEHIYG
tara:strand:+ start:5200 stop:6555 length:1356 start_codon:yes stop_codon:yes gene_type:complete